MEEQLFNLELEETNNNNENNINITTTTSNISPTPGANPVLNPDPAEDLPADLPYRNVRSSIRNLLKTYTCYQMIPVSGKVVILDVRLPLRCAFQALMESDVSSAPLWNSARQEIVGMITVTDFIDILSHFYSSPQNHGTDAVIPQLGKYCIEEGRKQIPSTSRPSNLVYCSPEDTLFQACTVMLTHNINRVPIIDPVESLVLHVISHYRILSFIWRNLIDEFPREFLDMQIGETGIGTFTNVVTTLIDTPLIVLLSLLSERKISAVPLVDETGKVTCIYAKTDLAKLADHEDVLSKMRMPVQEILPEAQLENNTCKKTDTVRSVIQTFIDYKLRRIICVDNTGRIEGIISISDVLRFFFCIPKSNGKY